MSQSNEFINLMPVMPPPDTQPLNTGIPIHVDIPRVAGRRNHLTNVIPAPQTLDSPTKRLDQQSMQLWIGSEAYLRIIDFIQSLSDAVRNKKLSDQCEASDVRNQLRFSIIIYWCMEIEYPESHVDTRPASQVGGWNTIRRITTTIWKLGIPSIHSKA